MKLRVTETPIVGVRLIEIEGICWDARGFFVEPWHETDFDRAGLGVRFVQEGHSRSAKGVIRGLHYQDDTAQMGKLVRCTVGQIFDVAVDVRWDSATYGRWSAAVLSAENQRQLYVPHGCAHGFQALTDGAEVQYKQTGFYTPSAERSVRWDDAGLAIPWPIAPAIVSPKDARAPSFAALGRE